MPDAVFLLTTGIVVGLLFALVLFLLWKGDYTNRIRSEAVRQSKAVVRGQISEQFAPYLQDFEFNPNDAHFLGRPIDFVVFDGLADGDVRRIVFVEVKTGGATLTTRERRIRDAVLNRAVEWRELRMDAGSPLPG